MSPLALLPWLLPAGGLLVLLLLGLRPWLTGRRERLSDLPGFSEALGERTEAAARRLEEEAEELEYDRLMGKVDDASYQKRKAALSQAQRSLTELERQADLAVRGGGGAA
ncbi:MAG: hypothetical protein ACM3ZA_01450 [Bacillota bacterium]